MPKIRVKTQCYAVIRVEGLLPEELPARVRV